MKIAYFGLPLGALLLAHDGHVIVHATLARPEGLGVRRLRRTVPRGTKVVKPGTMPAAAVDFDLLVSWFYPKKLGPEILRRGALGSVGVHPSLLPRHRGPDPYFAAIDQGDAVTGVTAHRLEVEYDTGAMLGSEELSIDAAWDAWTLARKLDRPSLRVLRRVVAEIAAGTVVERSQDESLATLAPAPSDDDLELDVHALGAERAARRVRAAAPWPGAYVYVADESVVLERARLVHDAPALAPGELAVTASGDVLLGFAAGALAIERVRLEIDGEECTLAGEAWRAWVRART